MAKKDEAKPLDTPFAFDDAWLGDLADALEFDDELAGDEALEFVDDHVSKKNEHEEAELDIVLPSAELQEELPKAQEELIRTVERQDLLSSQAIDTQIVDVAALKELYRSDKKVTINGDDARLQVVQFLSLILMRVCDDLELLILEKHCEEACDVSKQFHRLANILSFAKMSEYLPLLAYAGNMLPISYAQEEIASDPVRRFDALKMRRFLDMSGEFLNCLSCLMQAIYEFHNSFEIERFNSIMGKIYAGIGLEPSAPSQNAPLPVYDATHSNILTTRTVNRLSRTLEALVTEALHHIESSVFYANKNGYKDAAHCLYNAAQIASEYKLVELHKIIRSIHGVLKNVVHPDQPPQSMLRDCQSLVDHLIAQFSANITPKKSKHLQEVLAKFMATDPQAVALQPFSNRWKAFLRDAGQLLSFDNVSRRDIRGQLLPLREFAEKHDIHWLSKCLTAFNAYWDSYPLACSEAYIALCGEILAFPTEDIEAADIEQLEHVRIKLLFKRELNAPAPSPYSFVRQAKTCADAIMEQLATPEKVSSNDIHELYIDASRVTCPSLMRVCEVLLALMDRIPPKRDEEAVNVAPSVIDALYLTTALMQRICDKLLDQLKRDQNTPAIASESLFYESLLPLYQTAKQARDSIVYFMRKRLNGIFSEIELVWANTSTPTSSQYYCVLIGKLLHLANICESVESRNLIIAHLDDIPAQDFINTSNRSMKRHCFRIIKALDEACPMQNITSSKQVQHFFSKCIAALNQLLSSNDANDLGILSAEISRIESRMTLLGMTTDSPAVIAFIYELHSLALRDDIDRHKLEAVLYAMINLAHDVSPEWRRSCDDGLEFIKLPVSLPMTTFQQQLNTIRVLHESLKIHAHEEPVAWELISNIYKQVNLFVTYPPYALQSVVQNAQNRCSYLKKNIMIHLDTDAYPPASEVTDNPLDSGFVAAFTTVIGQFVELMIDNAFVSTDITSRIRIGLQLYSNACTASVVHNGKRLTHEEITSVLARVNIMAAPDDNLLDLIVSSKRLAITYPPATAFTYVLPVLRQFGGSVEISDDNQGNTVFFLSFRF